MRFMVVLTFFIGTERNPILYRIALPIFVASSPRDTLNEIEALYHMRAAKAEQIMTNRRSPLYLIWW